MKKLLVVFALSLVSFYSEALYADMENLPDTNNLILQTRLAGDVLGMRSTGMTRGVDITAQSYSDMLGNTLGGASAGATYSGVLNLGVAVDLNEALGWEGASFKNSWLWIYGNNLSDQNIHNSLTASGIAGDPAIRCCELWFQQNFLQDAVSFRLGLLGLDEEFLTSDTASFFVNGTFDMPGIFTLDAFQGQPVYQNATPGLRVALQPTSWLTLRSVCAESSQFLQQVNRSGFDWNFNNSGDLLFLNEATTYWNQDTGDKGLPGTAKLGFWIQSNQTLTSLGISHGSSTDQRYNTGFYCMVNQQLTIVSDKSVAGSHAGDKNSISPESGQSSSSSNPANPNVVGLSSFARIGFSPQLSSPVSLYADSGFLYTGLIPGREFDKLGLAFGYATARAPLFTDNGFPPSFEAVGELSYSIQISPAISIQPDLQYILHPGGTQQYGNALVVGMRAVVNF